MKRKAVDLTEQEDDDVWSSGIFDPEKDQAALENHLSNMEAFVLALRNEAGKNSENAETLLKALLKEANELCKTNAFHKPLSAIFNDVVESDDDLSDVEETSIDNVSDPHEKSWLIMFQELRDYRIVNGDCKVPYGWKQNPKLGNWVNNQKRNYKQKKLKPDRIEKLEGIGMYWGKNYPPPVSWD